jgi:hypothetical protein
MLLSNSLWCQEVWHYTALRTGLAMAPGPLMVPFVTAASARLVHRLGAGPIAAAGCLLFSGALLWRIAFVGVPRNYAGDLLPSMLIGGVGVGLAMGTLIAAAVTALPADRSATGSGLVNSARQVSSALGVAVLITLLARHVDPVSAFRAGWWVAVGLGGLGALISLSLGTSRGAREDRLDRPEMPENVLTVPTTGAVQGAQ